MPYQTQDYNTRYIDKSQAKKSRKNKKGILTLANNNDIIILQNKGGTTKWQQRERERI